MSSLVAVSFEESLLKSTSNCITTPQKPPVYLSCSQSAQLDRVASIKKANILVVFKYQGKSLGLQTCVPHEVFTNEEERNKAFIKKARSPHSCDPLLRFVDLADFEDDKKLQRNFEEVVRIRRMGFPVKILKQKWFPGLMCIPVFHCQQCLGLWTEAAQVPTFCSEVSRSVFGRLMPISSTKCDLLTKHLAGGERPKSVRLCEQQTILAKQSTKTFRKSCDNTEKVSGKSCPRKILKQLPVAEFVDIGEIFHEFRERAALKSRSSKITSWKDILNSTSHDANTITIPGIENEASEGDDIRVEAERKVRGDEIADGKNISGDSNEKQNEGKLSSVILDSDAVSNQSDRIDRPSRRARSGYSRQNKVGHFGTPPARASFDIQRHLPRRLSISSRIRDGKPGLTGLITSYDWRTRKQSLRHESEDAKKLTQQQPPLETRNNNDIILDNVVCNDVIPNDQLPLVENELRNNTRADAWGKPLRDSPNQNQHSWSEIERPVKFKNLMGEMEDNEHYIRDFQWVFTRPFCFSYFPLLRKL